jgi:hypothetical protein
VTGKGQYGRVLLDPASAVLFAAPAVILVARPEVSDVKVTA